MKTSKEWLEEYSNIKVSTKELSDILTMTGSKVEEFITKGEDIKNVVVGKILEIEKHPDAEKLVVTKVDVGIDTVQIVTGAKNIAVGDIIPVAKDGSSLPGGVKIKKGLLRGIESCGMMCSIGELSLDIKDCQDQIEDGIMILDNSFESKIGMDIVEVLNLKEDIIEFEITSNRPDCFSIEGLGRETAVSLNEQFKNPRSDLEKIVLEKKDEISGLKVNVESDICHRYMACVVENVKVGESPEWMKRRLKSAGVRSVNNIVDITNYVMLELGNPMHAFDFSKIGGSTVNVRESKDGEKITTLDEVERELNPGTLIIADNNKPMVIAGVMGGVDSGITEDTQKIVLEAAVFEGGIVRKTAKKEQLRTESSSRFEKGLSVNNVERAMKRACQLITELNMGNVVSGVIDVTNKKQEQVIIKLDDVKVNRLLGTNIIKEDMIKILESLEIKVVGDNLEIPYFRPDLEQVADIAEEVARFYGYDKLDTKLSKLDTTVGLRNKEQTIGVKLKEILVNNSFSEIYTYGFVSKQDLKKSNISDEQIKDAIVITNPLSEEYKYMRPTTVPSIMQVLQTNYNKKNKDVRLFDLSRRYQNVNQSVEKGEVPLEENILTLGMYGENVDFFVLKGIIENVLEKVGVSKFDVEKEVLNNAYHTGRCANIKVGIDVIGTFGEVHPELLENYGIDTRSYIAEINMSKVSKYAKTAKKYEEVPKFPASQRDTALIMEEKVEVGQIEKVITKKAKKILESVTLFDIYRNEKLGENMKSVAYSLIFRDKNKTLEDKEVENVMKDILDELAKQFGIELRK